MRFSNLLDMTKKDTIKLFEDKKNRSLWDDETEKWYFSIIDTIEALVGTDRPRKYWNDLKIKLEKEGSEVSEKIGQLNKNSEKNTKIIRQKITKNTFCIATNSCLGSYINSQRRQ